MIVGTKMGGELAEMIGRKEGGEGVLRQGLEGYN